MLLLDAVLEGFLLDVYLFFDMQFYRFLLYKVQCGILCCGQSISVTALQWLGEVTQTFFVWIPLANE